MLRTPAVIQRISVATACASRSASSRTSACRALRNAVALNVCIARTGSSATPMIRTTRANKLNGRPTSRPQWLDGFREGGYDMKS